MSTGEPGLGGDLVGGSGGGFLGLFLGCGGGLVLGLFLGFVSAGCAVFDRFAGLEVVGQGGRVHGRVRGRGLAWELDWMETPWRWCWAYVFASRFIA